MNKIRKSLGIMTCLICIFFFTGFTTAQEEEYTVIGEIRELVDTEHIIMVKERNYIVIAVYVDDGQSEEPLPASFNDLKVGSIVAINVGDKSDGFWTAKKVCLFTGEKEKAFRNKPNENE
jgi:hypothetical protein